MIESNLPALHVIIPLIAAGICLFFKNHKNAWAFAFAAILLSFTVCVMLVVKIGEEDVLSYFMGNWGKQEGYDYPVGIEYRIDKLNSIILLLISFIGAIMMPFARKSIEHEIEEEKRPLFYTMYLLCFAGLLGIVSTNDLFNIYVFIEISSLATYTLIALGKDRRALAAAFEYLILGTIGATFILIGIGFLYMMTGTLNISDMALRIDDVAQTRPVEAAFAFLTIGLAMKIALFPMHIWLTNSYTYAPSFVTAFLAATATKVMLYVFIRVIYSLFGFDFAFTYMPLTEILVTLAVLAIIVGSISAIYQPNVKRTLAFSSVAQLGYIVLAVGIGTEIALAASVTVLINHALAKGLLFLCVGAVALRAGGVRIENFAGIARYMPLTMLAFVLGGFSLIGVPLTAGFVGKWYLLQSLIEKGWWALVGLLLCSSIVAVIYIWKVVEAAYFKERPVGSGKIEEAPAIMLISIWGLVFANIYFGIDTSLNLGFVIDAASQIFHGGR